MRKVIFEQTGNILLTIILTIASCQTVATSTYILSNDNYHVDINFGWAWFIFFLSTPLFYFVKTFYEKKLGQKDGYNKKDGELSSQDERENIISGKATKIAYRVAIFGTLLILASCIYVNAIFSSKIMITIAFIIGIGSCAALIFLSYLIAWIVYDNKF